jgi:hypothetical protein
LWFGKKNFLDTALLTPSVSGGGLFVVPATSVEAVSSAERPGRRQWVIISAGRWLWRSHRGRDDRMQGIPQLNPRSAKGPLPE